MPELLPVLFGAVAGLALGWAAWVISTLFIAGDRGQEAHAQDPLFSHETDAGSTSLGAALAPATMTLWGAYVGWQASSLAVATCALVVTALLLTLSLVDFQTRRLPNLLVLAVLGCAVLQALWLGKPTLSATATGMAVALAVFGLIYLLGRGALGLGDVKLEAALGALLGWPAMLAAIFAGVLAGGLAAAFLLLTRRAGRKDSIAYGPYLALGAWLVYTRVLGLWPG
jgi:prepilin signal peptidase PulO-like enzyme (type II secretory pathway)